MSIKSIKLATILSAALALGTASADAAARHGEYTAPTPSHSYTMPADFHDSDAFGFRDRYHRPAPRIEIRMRMPHRGYHWHAGNWNWQRGHWVWASGFWNFR
jgi:hypothetical protein